MDRFEFCAGLLGGALLSALPLTARAQAATSAPLDTPGAVDMAGRLRMLSQRAVKAYLLAGPGMAAEGAAALLQESLARFATQLDALQSYTPTPATQDALALLKTRWTPFQALLAAPPSREGAMALYDASEVLQQAAHRATVAYENVSGAPLDHLIGIAGRQRMLSQRMAKFYGYRAWGLYEAASDMELHLSRAHFTAVLTQIESSHRVSAATKAAAVRVRRDWEPYQQALFASKDAAQMRQGSARVAALSEQVLAATEELVALLVAQARAR